MPGVHNNILLVHSASRRQISQDSDGQMEVVGTQTQTQPLQVRLAILAVRAADRCGIFRVLQPMNSGLLS
jgi:hypothetical protein